MHCMLVGDRLGTPGLKFGNSLAIGVHMNLRENLEKKVESQIDVWNRKIEELEAEAQRRKAEAKNDQMDAEMRENIAKTVKKLRSNVEDAREKLGEIKKTGESELKKMKSDLDSWLH